MECKLVNKPIKAMGRDGGGSKWSRWLLTRKDLARLTGETWDSDFGEPAARGAQREGLARHSTLAGELTVRVLLRQLRKHAAAQWAIFCLVLKSLVCRAAVGSKSRAGRRCACGTSTCGEGFQERQQARNKVEDLGRAR